MPPGHTTSYDTASILPWPRHCFPPQFMFLYTKILSSLWYSSPLFHCYLQPVPSNISKKIVLFVSSYFAVLCFDELPPPLRLLSGASVYGNFSKKIADLYPNVSQLSVHNKFIWLLSQEDNSYLFWQLFS